MDRGSVGWVQKGKELQPEAVQFTRLFLTPEAKFLLLWCEDKILSCVYYEKMNQDTARGMCARRGQLLKVSCLGCFNFEGCVR